MQPNPTTTDALPYITALGPEFVKLFDYSRANRKRIMLDRMIGPRSFTPSSYIALSDTKFSVARNFITAEQITNGIIGIERAQFFTNEMSYGEVDDETMDQSDIDIQLRPVNRAILGRYVVFTFECDHADVAFFKRQLKWCIPADRPERTRIFEIYRAMSRYTDFAGITVVWGGNKSLHIHIVFDTATYVAAYGLPRTPYDSLSALWYRLQQPVMDILEAGDVGCDTALHSSIAFRRTPWSFRRLEKTNVIGMPQGCYVEQTVLFEKWRERAGKDASRSFFNASSFTEGARKNERQKEAAKREGGSCGPNFTPDELRFCEAQLRKIFPICPRFDRLDYDSGQNEWVAYFYNSDRDRSPKSVMREPYATVLAVGTDAELVTGPTARLAYPLGRMLRLWQKRAADLAALVNPTPQAIEDNGDPFFVFAPQRRPDAIFANVCEGIKSKDALRRVVQGAAERLINDEAISVLRATEGAGKTTGLLTEHSANMAGASGLAMYAFGDYVNAEEKCAAFNALGHRKYHGVVWRSFSRAYSEACTRLNVRPFTMTDVCAADERSLWSLVNKRQSGVIAEFQREHRAMWDEIGGRTVVIFTVHAVAHGWCHLTQTRKMWTRHYWDKPTNDDLKLETELHMLVHDECSVDTFVHTVSEAQYLWLDMNDEGLRFLLESGRIADAYKLYSEGVPCPDCENFQALTGLLAVDAWEIVTTKDSGEFMKAPNSDPDKDIYLSTHGNRWFIGRRNWWAGIAKHILFITTEYTPVAVARRAIPAIHVVDINAPQLLRDEVDVVCHRLTSADAQASAAEDQAIAADNGMSLTVVTNRAKGVDIISHAAAKGRNDLASKNIVQYVFFPHPTQYEKMQALNAFTGRTDLVLRSITDAINQTCGRNLGFRNKGDTLHSIAMPHRLYDMLTHSLATAWLRYDLLLAETAEQRREKKRND
jgi:hypothetical protein